MNINSQDTVKDLGMVPKKMVGTVTCVMKDKDGNVVFQDTVHNNILLNIRYTIIELLAGSAYEGDISKFPYVKYLTLGTSADKTPDSLDIEELLEPLPDSQTIVRMASVSGVDNKSKSPSVTFAFLYNANTPALEKDSTVIREMGLWDAKGRLIARTTVGGWQKRQGIYFEIYWTIGYAA